jgi:hypothetical protein
MPSTFFRFVGDAEKPTEKLTISLTLAAKRMNFTMS